MLNKTVSTLQTRGQITTGWCAAAAAMVTITIATLVGNLAVLMALRRLRRAPAHYPLASLAAADLLVAVFVMPIASARDLFVFRLNTVICACWSTLDVLCSTASILSICVLGWERCCAITAPLARAQRRRRARMYAALVWPVAAAVALPTAFVPSPLHWHEGQPAKACTVNTNVGYVFSSIIFSFYLPAVAMVVLYGRILRALAAPPTIRAHRGRSPCPPHEGQCTLRKGRRASPSSPTVDNQVKTTSMSPRGCHLNLPDSTQPDASSKSYTKPIASLTSIMLLQRRATRTIATLMALFLVCWTPFFIMLPADSICDCVWDPAFEWCTWLGYTNSALNPMVYAAASPSVRRALHASLTSTSSRNIDVPLSPNVRRA
ncbi:5-hydroxytryptamine receptor 1D-like [Epargyreus clarus]|uniref:5-hydroxytryptamine receptor 1D-like n=1 Tax=Epargyreus clarus TaxID=520877 RepID=UPI003C2B656A